MVNEKDLRWIDSKTGERVTHLKTLKAQIDFGGFSQTRRAELEKRLPTMSEDAAEKELIKIEGDLRSNIAFYRNCQ